MTDLPKPQLDEVKAKARELGCDEEDRVKASLTKVAKKKGTPDKPGS